MASHTAIPDKSLTEKGKDSPIRHNPYAKKWEKRKELPIRKLMPLPRYKSTLAEDLAHGHSENCPCSKFSTGFSGGFTVEQIRHFLPGFSGFDATPHVEPQVEKPKVPVVPKPLNAR